MTDSISRLDAAMKVVEAARAACSVFNKDATVENAVLTGRAMLAIEESLRAFDSSPAAAYVPRIDDERAAALARLGRAEGLLRTTSNLLDPKKCAHPQMKVQVRERIDAHFHYAAPATRYEARVGDVPKDQRGLYGKFRVERTDGRSAPGEKHHGCPYFVLDLRHDPHANPAIVAYAKSARTFGFDALADDLERLRRTNPFEREIPAERLAHGIPKAPAPQVNELESSPALGRDSVSTGRPVKSGSDDSSTPARDDSAASPATRCGTCGTQVRANLYWAFLAGPGSQRVYYPKSVMDDNPDIRDGFTICIDNFHAPVPRDERPKRETVRNRVSVGKWSESKTDEPAPEKPAAGDVGALIAALLAENEALKVAAKERDAMLDEIGEIVGDGRGEACVGLGENGGFGLWLPEDGYAHDPDSSKVPMGETVEEAIRLRLEKRKAISSSAREGKP